MYSPVPNNRGEGGLNKTGEPRGNLNINKQGIQIKEGGDLKNVLGQKWQPVITNYG